MRLNQFESEDARDRREMPWRRHAPPVNKPTDPKNPNHKGPIDVDKWNQLANQFPKKRVEEESNGVPEPGDVIRTKKMQMEGKVESVGTSSAGYPEVMFRIEDGRLMKTPLSNVVVVQKLADCDLVMEVAEERIDEISTEVLAKYKAAASKDASAANAKAWNPETPRDEADKAMQHGNKRFSGIVKATKKQFDNETKKKTDEGSMGGINRSAPAQDVSYEKVLDEVKAMWEQAQLNELSVAKLKAYKDAAGSSEVAKYAPLRKVAKHVHGAHVADQKIKTKTGDRTGMRQPERGTMEEADDMGDIVRQQNPEKRTEEKKYNGWTIRYQLIPSVKGGSFKWMAWNDKRDISTAKQGESSSPEQAYQDATAFINAGAGEERKYNSNRVTIDFNSQFSKQIVPGGEPFYAKIDDGFIIVSLRPQEGFSKASPRAETDGSERFWSMPLTTKEAEMQKLVPNGRYSLGSKDEIDSETSMFDIHFQSVAQSSKDRIRMREPGFTVAAART